MKKHISFALIITILAVLTVGVDFFAVFLKNNVRTYEIVSGENRIEVGPLTSVITVINPNAIRDYTLRIEAERSELTVNFAPSVVSVQSKNAPVISTSGTLILNIQTTDNFQMSGDYSQPAVIAEKLVINADTNITLNGGNGANGHNGENGKRGANGTAATGGHHDGTDGNDGVRGGNGAVAVDVGVLMINNLKKTVLKSGNGGNGGKGGDGGDVPDNSWLVVSKVVCGNGGNGGNGGKGGDGAGYGPFGSIVLNGTEITDFKEKVCFAGKGGNGGLGGRGGTGGSVTNTSLFDKSTVHGKDGIAGTNGIPGKDSVG